MTTESHREIWNRLLGCLLVALCGGVGADSRCRGLVVKGVEVVGCRQVRDALLCFALLCLGGVCLEVMGKSRW